jgi:outer membrane beta-barrel protein
LLVLAAAGAADAATPAVEPAAAVESAPAAPPVAVPAVATTPAAPPAVEPAVAMAELPGIGDDPAIRTAQRGTPASLPPVTAQMFKIGGRIEAQPLFQMSIGDPFYRTLLAGIRVEHHLDERFSVGVHVLGGGSTVSAPIALCGNVACDAPAAAKLRSAPGNIQMMTGIELGWTPIYGKLSLIGEKTIHFDAYLSAGPEILRERIAPDAATEPSGRWAFGGRFSVGERIFLSDRLMIRLGASEVLYGSHVRGQGELGRKLSLEGGVAWLFGGSR